MGVLESEVKDVPRGFTDSGVAFSSSVEVPYSYTKVVTEMRSFSVGMNEAGIRYSIGGPNSNSAAFSLMRRLGISITPPVPAPGYRRDVP